MAKLSEIVEFLDRELDLKAFSDSSKNGVQVEGRPIVMKVGIAVDAATSTVKQAVERGCDMLIVHHGLFWTDPVLIKDDKRELFQQMIRNDLTVYAAHLPLDAHSEFGNNSELSRILSLSNLEQTFPYNNSNIGFVGTNENGYTLDQMVAILRELPGADEALKVYAFGPAVPDRVGVVSGGAAGDCKHHAEFGFDTFVTGENSYFVRHYASDNNINVICAGHYATETLGVRAIGAELQRRFGVEIEFIFDPAGA